MFAAAAGILWLAILNFRADNEKNNGEVLAGDRRHIIGEEKSSLAIVEFADFECAPCRSQHSRMIALLKAFPGKIHVVFRNFPLTSIHEHAMNCAIASEVSTSYGKYSQVHDAIMTGSTDDKSVLKVLSEVGITPAMYQSSLNSAREAVVNDIKAARAAGISSTPTMILCKGARVIARASSFDDLKPFVEANLVEQVRDELPEPGVKEKKKLSFWRGGECKTKDLESNVCFDSLSFDRLNWK